MAENFAMSRAALAAFLRQQSDEGRIVVLHLDPGSAEQMAERFEEVDRWCDLALARDAVIRQQARALKEAEALIERIMAVNAKALPRHIGAWFLGLGTGVGLGFWAGELLKGWMG